jgi:hypothetical protein
MLVCEVDDALAILLSLGEVRRAEVDQALVTIYTLLYNIYSCPNDMKYRNIDMRNSIFQCKIANINGAVELLLAAGFVEVIGHLQHNLNPEKVEYVLMRIQTFVYNIQCNADISNIYE